ncbi:retrotransposon hot spot (RHS) protein, partial [Trypanosoma theileri]
VAKCIVMNCPTVREIKAICAWEKRNQSNELENYWREIKERINNIGPLPRFIFSDGAYEGRCFRVQDTLDRIKKPTVSEYMDILRGDGEWKDNSPSHKLVKIYRLAIDDVDLPRNETFTNELSKKIFVRVIEICHAPYLKFFFTDRGLFIAEHFEKLGVIAFINREFVTALGEVLTIIQPPESRRKQKSVLQQRGLVAYASNGYDLFPSSINDVSRKIEYNKLYRPSPSNFPLVDGFYFVKSEEERVTLIGIQTTTAKRHETTVTAVIEFNKYLKNCFSDWTDVSKKVSWEIIYLQPYDTDERRRIKGWQKCTSKNSGKYTVEQKNATAKFWNEKVNQYQVNLSLGMAVRLVESLEDTRKRKKLSNVEDLINEKRIKRTRR